MMMKILMVIQVLSMNQLKPPLHIIVVQKRSEKVVFMLFLSLWKFKTAFAKYQLLSYLVNSYSRKQNTIPGRCMYTAYVHVVLLSLWRAWLMVLCTYLGVWIIQPSYKLYYGDPWLFLLKKILSCKNQKKNSLNQWHVHVHSWSVIFCNTSRQFVNSNTGVKLKL